MGLSAFLQGRQLFVVKHLVIQQAPGQLDELIECPSAPMKVWEREAFNGSVSADRWDPAKQTVAGDLPWDGTLVELQHQSVAGNQSQVSWVRQWCHHRELILWELQRLQLVQTRFAVWIDDRDWDGECSCCG